MAEQHLRKNIEAISQSRNKLKNLLKMCHLFLIKLDMNFDYLFRSSYMPV